MAEETSEARVIRERYPQVAHLLQAYLVGDDEFDDEVRGYARAAQPADLAATRTALHELITDDDVADASVTSFVQANSSWLFDDDGRTTLRRVLELLPDDSAGSEQPE